MSNVLAAGTIVQFISGPYFDEIDGKILEVLKSFDYMKEAKRFYIQECKKRQEMDGDFYVDQEEFDDYLVKEGLCKPSKFKRIRNDEGCFFDRAKWYEEWKESKFNDGNVE